MVTVTTVTVIIRSAGVGCWIHHCRCQMPLSRCLRSNCYPIIYHLIMCILQQVLKIVVGAMLMVVVVFGGFVAGQEERLHIGIDSQEIPHGDE